MTWQPIEETARTLQLHTGIRTLEIQDGRFRSLCRGHSMDFDDLREYVPTDAIRDIDWKASSRTDSLLVRETFAERSIRVLIILDGGKNMAALTSKKENKYDLMLKFAGCFAWNAMRNTASCAFLRSSEAGYEMTPFAADPAGIDILFHRYDAIRPQTPAHDLSELVSHVLSRYSEQVIVLCIGGREALEKVSMLPVRHDMYFVMTDDLSVCDSESFLIEQNTLARELFFVHDALRKQEGQYLGEKKAALQKAFSQKGGRFAVVSADEDIYPGMLDLLKEDV